MDFPLEETKKQISRMEQNIQIAIDPIQEPLNSSEKDPIVNHAAAETSTWWNCEKKRCTCEVCGKLFARKSNLKIHMLAHSGEKRYLCELCSRPFSYKSALKKHILTHNEERKFLCELCSKSFKQELSFRLHKLAHMKGAGTDELKSGGEIPSFGCLICNDSFGDKRGLKIHMLVHIEKTKFSCPVCNRAFAYEQDLKRHIMFNHETLQSPAHNDAKIAHMASIVDERTLECRTCGEQCATRQNLASHILLTHGGEDTFACRVCRKSFSYRQGLIQHMVIHSKEKLFKCSVCHRSFLRRHSLTKHMLIHTGEKPFQCHVCHRSFALRRGLKNHMLVHVDARNKKRDKSLADGENLSNINQMEEKRFQCSVCDKSYRNKYHLFDHHMRTHSGGEKNYKCKNCKKEFSTSADLRQHMRQHLNSQGSHVCTQCNKGFLTSDYLKKHVKIHNSEQNHVCQKCNKGFTTSNSLRNHMSIHREAMFSCQFCDVSYRDRRAFRKHVLTHDTKKRCFDCSICGKSFELERFLNIHTREEHNKEKDSKYCVKFSLLSRSFKLQTTRTREGDKTSSTSGQNKHACPRCNAEFTESISLRRHMMTVHTALKRPYHAHPDSKRRFLAPFFLMKRNSHNDDVAVYTPPDSDRTISELNQKVFINSGELISNSQLCKQILEVTDGFVDNQAEISSGPNQSSNLRKYATTACGDRSSAPVVFLKETETRTEIGLIGKVRTLLVQRTQIPSGRNQSSNLQKCATITTGGDGNSAPLVLLKETETRTETGLMGKVRTLLVERSSGPNKSSNLRKCAMTTRADGSSFVSAAPLVLLNETQTETDLMGKVETLLVQRLSQFKCKTCHRFFENEFDLIHHLEFFRNRDHDLEDYVRVHSYSCGFCCQMFQTVEQVFNHFKDLCGKDA